MTYVRFGSAFRRFALALASAFLWCTPGSNSHGQAPSGGEGIKPETRLRWEHAISYANASSPFARKWWDAFVEENSHRPALIETVVTELVKRGRTVSDFFTAYCVSGTDNIAANLSFMDYLLSMYEVEDDSAGRALNPLPGEDSAQEELDRMGWLVCGGDARAWWRSHWVESKIGKDQLRNLLAEIERRDGTLDEYAEAAISSRAQTPRAVLHFIDYARLAAARRSESDAYYQHPFLGDGAPDKAYGAAVKSTPGFHLAKLNISDDVLTTASPVLEHKVVSWVTTLLLHQQDALSTNVSSEAKEDLHLLSQWPTNTLDAVVLCDKSEEDRVMRKMLRRDIKALACFARGGSAASKRAVVCLEEALALADGLRMPPEHDIRRMIELHLEYAVDLRARCEATSDDELEALLEQLIR